MLSEYAEEMSAALVAKIANTRRRLDDLQQRRPFLFPLEGIRDRQVRLDEIQERIQNANIRLIEKKKSLVTHAAGRLEALSPLNVLTRGYSLTQKPSGELLRDSSEVRVGDSVVTRLHRGRIESIVTAIPEKK
jgi:exodeoxyribonuclease VII large subunit